MPVGVKKLVLILKEIKRCLYWKDLIKNWQNVDERKHFEKILKKNQSCQKLNQIVNLEILFKFLYGY